MGPFQLFCPGFMTRKAIRRDGAASLQDRGSDRKERRARLILYGSTLRGAVPWSTSLRMSLSQYEPETDGHLPDEEDCGLRLRRA